MKEMTSLTLNGEKYDSFVDATARALSVGSAIIGSASGENITVYDASNYNLLDLHIYGKTTQDGTPTPDAPVELVSVGDSGSITVNTTGKNETKSMTLATPNGLLGVPVESGGNYTDANGQQWMCDEIDFSRGVHIKRIDTMVLREVYAGFANATNTNYIATVASDVYPKTNEISGAVLCDSLQTTSPDEQYKNNESSISSGNGRIKVSIKDIATMEDLTRWLTDNPIEFQYVLATPIETPLSEEELVAYADLRTYRNQVTISNDASAHMEIEYVMDAKKYIDNLVISGGGSVARLTSVTLLASSWTGSNSLYSQVVSIPGVTEYSKVDLLPSVEQLAIFHEKDVAFVTENEDGVVTVYAIGDKPLLDYTMQAQITEVLV